MKLQSTNVHLYLSLLLIIAGCHPKPKLYEGDPVLQSAADESTAHSSGMTDVTHAHGAQHTVIVEEVLDTDKYSYLHVSEEGEKFWIAIPRKEIVIGGTYHYQGGLLKKNFESKEYNRVFETIYLVSDVTPHALPSATADMENTSGSKAVKNDPVNVTRAEGSIKLSELFANKDSYRNKVVKVTGKCVKVNPMIMGRNWVHIQDGSVEGQDLTVTTTDIVQVNEVVSFEGKITLNKDFGAGYQYDIIMEEATLK